MLNDGWLCSDDWFYEKRVTFIKTGGEIADDGFFSHSSNDDSTLTVHCDVQPVSREDLTDDSGHYTEAQYKIFCDVNSFIKGCDRLIYNDEVYEIIKIVDWDDYYIVLIKAVK